MGWLKWPLLFSFAYGILWLRQELRAPNIDEDQGSIPVLDLEEYFRSQAQSDNLEPQNTESDSLNYGFQKLVRSPSDNKIGETSDSTYRGVLDLEKLLAKKESPQQLLEEANSQLKHIRRDELPERIIVLREVINIQNNDTRFEVEALLRRERDWLNSEINMIQDTDALSGYVGELFRLSMMADLSEDFTSSKSTSQSLISEFIQILDSHPELLNSLDFAIQNHAPWESETWKQSLTPEQRQSLNPTKDKYETHY